MDFHQAYHQIRVRPDSTDLLTFVIPYRGTYTYLKLQMGLSQSPLYMSLALPLLTWVISCLLFRRFTLLFRLAKNASDAS